MNDRKLLPGKFVWFELVTGAAARAQAFYGEVLGWKTLSFPMPGGADKMIWTGDTPDTMIGGYSTCDRSGPSSWISAVSVDDVDGAAARAVAAGGRIVEAAHDIPGVGRRVRVADPRAPSSTCSAAPPATRPTPTRRSAAGAGTSCTRPTRPPRSRSTSRSSGSATPRTTWGRAAPTTSCRHPVPTAAA